MSIYVYVVCKFVIVNPWNGGKMFSWVLSCGLLRVQSQTQMHAFSLPNVATDWVTTVSYKGWQRRGVTFWGKVHSQWQLSDLVKQRRCHVCCALPARRAACVQSPTCQTAIRGPLILRFLAAAAAVRSQQKLEELRRQPLRFCGLRDRFLLYKIHFKM